MKGRYANMWRKQIRAERAAEAASQMVAKAEALQKAAMERPGSSGNEGGPSEDVSENEADSRTLVQSRELHHPLSTAESALELESPAGDSQADNTLLDSASDEENSDRSSNPPDESHDDHALEGSGPYEESGKETSDLADSSNQPGPDSQNSPPQGPS